MLSSCLPDRVTRQTFVDEAHGGDDGLSPNLPMTGGGSYMVPDENISDHCLRRCLGVNFVAKWVIIQRHDLALKGQRPAREEDQNSVLNVRSSILNNE